MAKNDLEDRLINFAVAVITLSEGLKKSYAGNHLSEQIIRSSTSAALNYGEAQSAESRKDFVHKIKVVLKELRESSVNLKIILKANLHTDKVLLNKLIGESHELLSIFVASVKTARQNLNKG
jgi:four helix bundle protein